MIIHNGILGVISSRTLKGVIPVAVNSFIVRVSSTCVLDCHYCFAKHGFQGEGMLPEMLDHVIREIDSLGLVSVKMLWHGGEPLMLGLNQFRSGVELQKSLPTQFCNTVQTNGVLVTDSYADFFAENDFGVGISIDGYKEVHDANRPFRNGKGSFERAIRGLRKLQDRGLQVSCISVITNYCDPTRYFDFIQGLGISDFTMKPCTGGWEHSMSLPRYTSFVEEVYRLIASSEEDLPECREFMGYAGNIISGMDNASLCSQSGRCGDFVMIDTNGNVYPCDELTSDEFCWGNITDKTLKEILDSDERHKFLERVNHQNKTCEENCEAFNACRGGCTACHVFFKKNEYCDFLRSIIANIRRLVYDGVESWVDPNDEEVKKFVDPKLLKKA